jgi:hypothetical protein
VDPETEASSLLFHPKRGLQLSVLDFMFIQSAKKMIIERPREGRFPISKLSEIYLEASCCVHTGGKGKRFFSSGKGLGQKL